MATFYSGKIRVPRAYCNAQIVVSSCWELIPLQMNFLHSASKNTTVLHPSDSALYAALAAERVVYCATHDEQGALVSTRVLDFPELAPHSSICSLDAVESVMVAATTSTSGSARLTELWTFDLDVLQIQNAADTSLHFHRTGIKLSGVVNALAGTGDMLCIGQNDKVSVYDIHTSRKLFDARVDSSVVKIITSDPFMVVTMKSVVVLSKQFDATTMRLEECAMVSARNVQYDVEYVDAAPHPQIKGGAFVLNKDWKTFELDSDGVVKKWQKTTDPCRTAVCLGVHEGFELVGFTNGQIKLNEIQNLAFRGRYLLQDLGIPQLDGLNVVKCLPWHGNYFLVLSDSSSLVLKPEYSPEGRIVSCAVLQQRYGSQKEVILVTKESILTFSKSSLVRAPVGSALNEFPKELDPGLMMKADEGYIYRVQNVLKCEQGAIVQPGGCAVSHICMNVLDIERQESVVSFYLCCEKAPIAFEAVSREGVWDVFVLNGNSSLDLYSVVWKSGVFSVTRQEITNSVRRFCVSPGASLLYVITSEYSLIAINLETQAVQELLKLQNDIEVQSMDAVGQLLFITAVDGSSGHYLGKVFSYAHGFPPQSQGDEKKRRFKLIDCYHFSKNLLCDDTPLSCRVHVQKTPGEIVLSVAFHSRIELHSVFTQELLQSFPVFPDSEVRHQSNAVVLRLPKSTQIVRITPELLKLSKYYLEPENQENETKTDGQPDGTEREEVEENIISPPDLRSRLTIEQASVIAAESKAVYETNSEAEYESLEISNNSLANSDAARLVAQSATSPLPENAQPPLKPEEATQQLDNDETQPLVDLVSPRNADSALPPFEFEADFDETSLTKSAQQPLPSIEKPAAKITPLSPQEEEQDAPNPVAEAEEGKGKAISVAVEKQSSVVETHSPGAAPVAGSPEQQAKQVTESYAHNLVESSINDQPVQLSSPRLGQTRSFCNTLRLMQHQLNQQLLELEQNQENIEEGKGMVQHELELLENTVQRIQAVFQLERVDVGQTLKSMQQMLLNMSAMTLTMEK